MTTLKIRIQVSDILKTSTGVVLIGSGFSWCEFNRTVVIRMKKILPTINKTVPAELANDKMVLLDDDVSKYPLFSKRRKLPLFDGGIGFLPGIDPRKNRSIYDAADGFL
jgi:hypothetical protein